MGIQILVALQKNLSNSLESRVARGFTWFAKDGPSQKALVKDLQSGYFWRGTHGISGYSELIGFSNGSGFFMGV